MLGTRTAKRRWRPPEAKNAMKWPTRSSNDSPRSRATTSPPPWDTQGRTANPGRSEHRDPIFEPSALRRFQNLPPAKPEAGRNLPASSPGPLGPGPAPRGAKASQKAQPRAADGRPENAPSPPLGSTLRACLWRGGAAPKTQRKKARNRGPRFQKKCDHSSSDPSAVLSVLYPHSRHAFTNGPRLTSGATFTKSS